MRQVFLDTETTGLDPASGDRIVEIGCIEMVARRLTGNQRHYYLNPQRRSHPDALRVHGLSDEFLADQPKFEQVVDDLLGFVADAEIVIHNADFDVGFLDRELQRCGRAPFAAHVGSITDSLQLARELYPGKSNSLDALCRRLEVDNRARTVHGALLDAGLLAEVYIAMTRGQGALVIDAVDSAVTVAAAAAVDFAALALPVPAPSAEELTAHRAVLADIERSSKGRLLWRDELA